MVDIHPDLFNLEATHRPEHDIRFFKCRSAVHPGPQDAVVDTRGVQPDILLHTMPAVLAQKAFVLIVPWPRIAVSAGLVRIVAIGSDGMGSRQGVVSGNA